MVMIEQPEWARFRTKFIVTMNEVIKQEGILTKERVILPYATVADIRVEKSMTGRVLNYGNLSVSSFKAGSDMVMKEGKVKKEKKGKRYIWNIKCQQTKDPSILQPKKNIRRLGQEKRKYSVFKR